jgi:predicted transcriptional regulator
MFFLDYEITILQILWEKSSGIGSKEIWEEVNNRLRKISRASVISSLNKLVDEEYIIGYKETRVVRPYTIFSPRLGEKQLKLYLYNEVKNKIDVLIA